MIGSVRSITVGAALAALLLAGCSTTASTSDSAVQRDAAPPSSTVVPTNQEELASFVKASALECESGTEKWTKSAGAALFEKGAVEPDGQWPLGTTATQGLRALGYAPDASSRVVDGAGKSVSASVSLPAGQAQCRVKGSDVKFALGVPATRTVLRVKGTGSCVADEAPRRINGHGRTVTRPCVEWFGSGARMGYDLFHPGLSYPTVDSVKDSTFKMGGQCLTAAWPLVKLAKCMGDGGPQYVDFSERYGSFVMGEGKRYCLQAPTQEGRDMLPKSTSDGKCLGPRQQFEVAEISGLSPTSGSTLGCPSATGMVGCSVVSVIPGVAGDLSAGIAKARLWNLPVRISVVNGSGTPIAVSTGKGFDATKAGSAGSGADLMDMGIISETQTTALSFGESTAKVGASPAFGRFLTSGTAATVKEGAVALRIATTTDGSKEAATTCARADSFEATINGVECGFIDVGVSVPGGVPGTDTVKEVKFGCRVGGVVDVKSGDKERFAQLRVDKSQAEGQNSLEPGGFIALELVIRDNDHDTEDSANCGSAKKGHSILTEDTVELK